MAKRKTGRTTASKKNLVRRICKRMHKDTPQLSQKACRGMFSKGSYMTTLRFARSLGVSYEEEHSGRFN